MTVGGEVLEKGWAVGGEPRKVPRSRLRSPEALLYPASPRARGTTRSLILGSTRARSGPCPRVSAGSCWARSCSRWPRASPLKGLFGVTSRCSTHSPRACAQSRRADRRCERPAALGHVDDDAHARGGGRRRSSSDGERTADVDNPKGYFGSSASSTSRRETDKSYLREARGKAVEAIFRPQAPLRSQ